MPAYRLGGTPVIVVNPGDEMCKHSERILDGIGTCEKCGMTKDYRGIDNVSRIQRKEVSLGRITDHTEKVKSPKRFIVEGNIRRQNEKAIW